MDARQRAPSTSCSRPTAPACLRCCIRQGPQAASCQPLAVGCHHRLDQTDNPVMSRSALVSWVRSLGFEIWDLWFPVSCAGVMPRLDFTQKYGKCPSPVPCAASASSRPAALVGLGGPCLTVRQKPYNVHRLPALPSVLPGNEQRCTMQRCTILDIARKHGKCPAFPPELPRRRSADCCAHQCTRCHCLMNCIWQAFALRRLFSRSISS